MAANNPAQLGVAWFYFALLTVLAWGLYGNFLHTGQMAMADPENGRYKAFLFVGVAYFITAVLAPLLVLKLQGSSWEFPVAGMMWSLFAGTLGAVGAFAVLLAFGAKGSPSVVMAIVFAGAPIVNVIAVMLLHPPAGGLSSIRWPFVLGILLAASGGCLVMLFRPKG